MTPKLNEKSGNYKPCKKPSQPVKENLPKHSELLKEIKQLKAQNKRHCNSIFWLTKMVDQLEKTNSSLDQEIDQLSKPPLPMPERFLSIASILDRQTALLFAQVDEEKRSSQTITIDKKGYDVLPAAYFIKLINSTN